MTSKVDRQRYVVVILAAGDSSRLFPLTRDIPKCLLPIGEGTLLTQQIASFKACNIREFTIVAGYKSERFLPYTRNGNASLILNESYDNTNSLYSLWLTKRKYQAGVIVVNSDVYLCPELAEKMTSSKSRCAALVDRSSKWDRESTKVKIKAGRIELWSRDLTRRESSGENIGVVSMPRGHVTKFYDIVDRLIREGNENKWWPEALNKLAEDDEIIPIDSAGLPCKEIDTPADYADLLEILSADNERHKK